MRDAIYYTAQICLNGHRITDSLETSPERSQDFCDKCGSKTIASCPSCDSKIRGYYHVPGVYGIDPPTPAPAFCYKCGKPYPWTEAKLKAAQDLSEEVEGLNSQEKAMLKKSLDDIVRDTPQTGVAALRFKKLVAKSGKVAAEGFKDIVVDIISETAKKIIWPSG